MIVVADASPLHYLILIQHLHVLPALFGSVVVPRAVVEELSHLRAPDTVRAWISTPPNWLRIESPREDLPLSDDELGLGEREAIALAEELSADALLMDDRDGRREAHARGLAVLGTLRVLADAARQDIVNLEVSLQRLRQTNFRASEQLLQRIISAMGEK